MTLRPDRLLTNVIKHCHGVQIDNGIYARQEEGDNMYMWTGVFAGMPDGAYDGHSFLFRIVVPENFSFSPPRIEFITEVHHPLCRNGKTFDLDVLGHCWSPALCIRATLLMVQRVLQNPLDPDVLIEGCIPNPSWSNDFAQHRHEMMTPAPHRFKLLHLLFEAATFGASSLVPVPDWYQHWYPHHWHQCQDLDGAHFLKAIRQCAAMDLSLGPDSQVFLGAWLRFLAWLNQAYSRLQDQGGTNPHRNIECSYRGSAKAAWASEAQLLLRQLYWLSGLRVFIVTATLVRPRNDSRHRWALPQRMLRHIALFLTTSSRYDHWVIEVPEPGQRPEGAAHDARAVL